MATRPTSDRLRETLFNMLGTSIGESRFADLYAGSGAVGIEAVSRGAAHVLFSEKAPKALAAIRKNLKELQITGGFVLDTAGVASALKQISTRGQNFDIVFLDPPYEAEDEYQRTLSALGGSFAGILTPGAVVVAEHASRISLLDRYGLLQRTRTRLQGDAALSFFAVPEIG